MIEEWKELIDYEGLYEVSNLGRIRALKRTVRCVSRAGKEFVKTAPAKLITPKRGGNTDYLRVNLCKAGEVKDYSLHRLIAQTFVPNSENKKEVNHKDGNKQNNNIRNLEWVTRSENLKHRYRVLGQTNRRTA